MFRRAGCFVVGSMILNRSPSEYFFQRPSDALRGNAGAETPTAVLTSGDSSRYVSRTLFR